MQNGYDMLPTHQTEFYARQNVHANYYIYKDRAVGTHRAHLTKYTDCNEEKNTCKAYE